MNKTLEQLWDVLRAIPSFVTERINTTSARIQASPHETGCAVAGTKTLTGCDCALSAGVRKAP